MNKQGQIYVPSEMRKEAGLTFSKEAYIVADAKSIFVYPDDLNTKDALKSLEIIKKHLEHLFELEETTQKNKGEKQKT